MGRQKKYTDEEKRASNRYSGIKSRVSKLDDPYELSEYWSRESFIKWFIDEVKECCYCKCTEEELMEFYNYKHNKDKVEHEVKRIKRGKSLEIERKKDTKYTEDNCELACYWCNNAKSDVFTYEEFKPIGRQIGIAIKKNLNYD